MAFLLAADVDVAARSSPHPYLSVLLSVKSKLESRPTPSPVSKRFEILSHLGDDDDEELESAVFASTEEVMRVNFDGDSTEVVQAASVVVTALHTYLGDTRFRELVTRKKIDRILKSLPVSAGMDRDTLAEVLIEGLELPIDADTPEASKLDILTKVIGILADGGEPSAGAVSQLAKILANYP